MLTPFPVRPPAVQLAQHPTGRNINVRAFTRTGANDPTMAQVRGATGTTSPRSAYPKASAHACNADCSTTKEEQHRARARDSHCGCSASLRVDRARHCHHPRCAGERISRGGAAAHFARVRSALPAALRHGGEGPLAKASARLASMASRWSSSLSTAAIISMTQSLRVPSISPRPAPEAFSPCGPRPRATQTWR